MAVAWGRCASPGPGADGEQERSRVGAEPLRLGFKFEGPPGRQQRGIFDMFAGRQDRRAATAPGPWPRHRSTGGGQDISGRGDDLSALRQPDDGPRGAGLRCDGAAGRGVRRGQWHHDTTKLAILLLVVSLWGCRHAKLDDPAAEYRRIWSEFLKGNLDVAQQAAANERTKFAGRDGEWTYRFCLLEAEILSFRGQSEDVVAVLDEGGKSFNPSGDHAIKRDILLSVAYARIGQPERSASELADAKHLSAETHSGLEGEVLRTQGLSEDRRGDAQAAEIFYLKSLEQARLQHNAFLEAIDLLNLGKSALAAEHIDEALDRFNASSQIAQSIGASFILQTALGNAGWAYSELGDFDKALVSFKQAESAARSSGATSNDILWLEGAALATYRLGDLKQAEGLYEQALALAQSSKDLRRIAETETLLGLLLVQQGELEAAQRHSDAGLKAAGCKGQIERAGCSDVASHACRTPIEWAGDRADFVGRPCRACDNTLGALEG